MAAIAFSAAVSCSLCGDGEAASAAGRVVADLSAASFGLTFASPTRASFDRAFATDDAGGESVAPGIGGSSGNAGSSGIGGNSGAATASARVTLLFVAVLGDFSSVAPGHCGARLDAFGAGVVALASAATLGFKSSGGTPSDVSCAVACVADDSGRSGASLIFTYKKAPTAVRMMTVISGRMELIDRPP
jgi:hypothetical protein